MSKAPMVLPPGEHVFFNDRELHDPAARGVILRIYRQWLGSAERHLTWDDQAAMRFLFAALTQGLRKVLVIHENLQVIGVRGMGFDPNHPLRRQGHIELWVTIGKVPEKPKQVDVFKELPPAMRDAVSHRNEKAERLAQLQMQGQEPLPPGFTRPGARMPGPAGPAQRGRR